MKHPKLKVIRLEPDESYPEFKVDRVESYAYGHMLVYKDHQKRECHLAMKHGYKTLPRPNGYQYVAQVAGHDVAVNWFSEPDKDAPGEEYSALLRTHAAAETYKTITGSLNIPWKWVLIIGAVVIVGIMAYMMLKPETVVVQSTTTPYPLPTEIINNGN